jgi:hypothetical protein
VVKKRVKELMVASAHALNGQASQYQPQSQQSSSNATKYPVYEEENATTTRHKPDTTDQTIEQFIAVVADTQATNALDFWKVHEHQFPTLAILAKKYLSVQASSANVERMFSIAGHIFSVRRRCLGVVFFCALVWLKLNETML